MIESIEIANVASYAIQPESLNDLRTVNWFYGSNGTGKSTIAKVIADPLQYMSCRIRWERGSPLRAFVYNRDFVTRNFSPDSEIRGVFTLGEESVETQKKLAEAKAANGRLEQDLEQLKKTLGGTEPLTGKLSEMDALYQSFRETCWDQKKKHDEHFKAAFKGFRDSSANFTIKLLEEFKKNSASLKTLEDLKGRAATIFGTAPTTEESMREWGGGDLLDLAANPILQKRIVGRDDIDIAAMIQKLGNSDWVRQGRQYLDVIDMHCPFCQQQVTASLKASLEQYFDESFVRDSAEFNSLEATYQLCVKELLEEASIILAKQSRFLNLEQFRSAQGLFESRAAQNLQVLAQKRAELSRNFELESLKEPISALRGLIQDANALVTEHNRMVANLQAERQKLTSEVWKYVLEAELGSKVRDYNSARKNVQLAIDSLSNQVTAKIEEMRQKQIEISRLEKETASIQPTVDAINQILQSFGFLGFSLRKAPNGNSYQLLRADGQEAKDTLSEGERTFVTFLYFHHLISGSDSETGLLSDRIVLFDDPVSSLDSDVLFVVSTLIRSLVDQVKSRSSLVKQVFVFTHNVYFHKEVTFDKSRSPTSALRDESFWIVRKRRTRSVVERSASNPVKTSYELLWAEARHPEVSSVTLQNTLRRILESYFKMIGGLDLNAICDKFSGNEKLLCRSLCSWIHDGSHLASDNLFFTVDETAIEKYFPVFKGIFSQTGHEAHYRMMMGETQEAATVA